MVVANTRWVSAHIFFRGMPARYQRYGAREGNACKTALNDEPARECGPAWLGPVTGFRPEAARQRCLRGPAPAGEWYSRGLGVVMSVDRVETGAGRVSARRADELALRLDGVSLTFRPLLASMVERVQKVEPVADLVRRRVASL